MGRKLTFESFMRKGKIGPFGLKWVVRRPKRQNPKRWYLNLKDWKGTDFGHCSLEEEGKRIVIDNYGMQKGYNKKGLLILKQELANVLDKTLYVDMASGHALEFWINMEALGLVEVNKELKS